MNLLIVDDEPAHIEAIRRAYEGSGAAVSITAAGTMREYRELSKSSPPDIALLDLNLPDGRAVEALNSPPENGPFPVLIMTGQGDEKSAVESIKAGAIDYIVKSAETLRTMPRSVERALREWELMKTRKLITDALRASQSFMKTVLDTMHGGIVIIDAKTREIVDANAYSLKLIGASREQIIGAVCHKYICPADIGKCPVCDLGQRVDDSERILIRQNGTKINILKTVVPVNINGEDCLLEHFIDITERKRAEADLRESENRYRSIYLYSHDAIMTLTPERGFLSGNPAAIRIFGCADEKDFTSRSPARLSPELQPDGRRSQDKALEMMQLALKKGSHFFEWTHIRADGANFPATVLLSKLDYAGDKNLLLATVRDISEQKQAEEKARRTQKMEIIGRMAGSVAHDFNNLLSIIMSNCSFLLNTTPATDPRRPDMEEIREAGGQAATLIRHLLAFSRSQTSQPRAVNINGVIAEIIKLLHTLSGATIEIRTSLAPDLATVKADPGQIEQIIMNLAVNARDAMPGGGTITLETCPALISEESRVELQPEDIPPGRYVVLTIADNGSGMDNKVMTHIFEPFFTTKGPGKGTGLGLATVYDIVKKSSGFIGIKSAPGSGTTFKIFLPEFRA